MTSVDDGALTRVEQAYMSYRDRIFIFATRVALTGVVWHAAMSTAVAQDVNPDYESFEKAVLDGRDVRLTLDLSRCTGHGVEARGPQVRGSIRFDGYMIRGDQTVAFATTHFTLREDNTPVDEFLSFRVYPSGKVEGRTAFINPITFAVTRESRLDCDIGQGVTFHC
jgi:cation diffusion facilitator CzcD-associated flavoprotein CzcO